MPKIDNAPQIVRGQRFEVTTWTSDARNPKVPVRWSFLDRAGAAKLAAQTKGKVVEIKRGSDAEDRNDQDS